MQARIAAAGGGQAPDPAPLPLHTGVAAAPAPADKLQEQEAAQLAVYHANVYDDLCGIELAKAEKQHDVNLSDVFFSSEAVGACSAQQAATAPPQLGDQAR